MTASARCGYAAAHAAAAIVNAPLAPKLRRGVDGEALSSAACWPPRGVEHDHDCAVARPTARLLSPGAALKQLDELELARHPPHPAAPQSSSNVIPFRRSACGVPRRSSPITEGASGGLILAQPTAQRLRNACGFGGVGERTRTRNPVRLAHWPA